MKKMILLAVVLFMFGITANAQSYEIGENEPCTPIVGGGCLWEGPNVLTFEVDGCTDCKFMAEYYYKKNCGGRFIVQVVTMYEVKCDNNYDSFLCHQCTGGITDEAFHLAYVRIFQEYEQYIDAGDYQLVVQQKSCRSSTGNVITGTSVPSFPVNVPVSSVDNFDPDSFPSYSVGDEFVVVEVMNVSQFCDSECCCYELTDYWNRDDPDEPFFTGLYCNTPCGSNETYDCPEGCYGGCQNLEFAWNTVTGLMKRVISEDRFSGIEINPNPNGGEFNINLNNDYEGKITISVYDIAGNIVAEIESMKLSCEFNITADIDLHNGTYTVVAETAGEVIQYGKIIVEK